MGTRTHCRQEGSLPLENNLLFFSQVGDAHVLTPILLLSVRPWDFQLGCVCSLKIMKLSQRAMQAQMVLSEAIFRPSVSVCGLF